MSNHQTEMIQIACFEARESSYGLPVEMLREIVPLPEISPLPDAPPFVEGLIDLRGRWVPVVDLSRVLGRGAVLSGMDRRTGRVVVVNYEGRLFGLCVEAATDVLSVDPLRCEDVPPVARGAEVDVIEKVIRREGEAPVMVLSIGGLLKKVGASRRVGNEGEVAA